MIEYNVEQMSEKDLLDAANRIFSIEEKDFKKIKLEKWYQTLFHAITLNQDGIKYQTRGICSLAKLQQLFLEIYVRNYRGTHTQLTEILESVIQNQEAIKKLYSSCVLHLEEQASLSSLDVYDAEILALFLGEYRDSEGKVPEKVQKYNCGVLAALNTAVPNGMLMHNQIEKLKNPEIVYRCFLEQCAVDGTIDSHEWTDKIYEDLDDFAISQNRKREIEKTVKYEAEIAGIDYFLVKYSRDALDVLDSDFEIDNEILNEPVENQMEDETKQSDPNGEDEDIDTSIPRDPLELSGIISIDKKQIYKNKEIHFSSAIINCAGELEFRNCTIHYNENAESNIYLGDGAALTILGSTVVCHGGGLDGRCFVQSQSANRCIVKGSCFVDCVNFITGRFDKFLFSDNECCDCCLKFLDIKVGHQGNARIDTSHFIFSSEPGFAPIAKLRKSSNTCISVSKVDSEESTILISNCNITCIPDENGLFCTYMDTIGFLQFNSREECDTQIGFCTFTGVKNCVIGKAFIYNCIFKHCQNVISTTIVPSSDGYRIMDNQFIDCCHVAQRLPQGSLIKNCQFWGSTQGEYITTDYGATINIESCEFVNFRHKRGKDSIASGIIELAAVSKTDIKKNGNTTISRCIFNGIQLISEDKYHRSAFLVSVSYGQDPLNTPIANVSECIFLNCATDSPTGEIIRRENTHYGLFNRAKQFEAIRVQNCTGYGQVTDLMHYREVTDFELKQVDGEGHGFGSDLPLTELSREDCLNIKAHITRNEFNIG